MIPETTQTEFITCPECKGQGSKEVNIPADEVFLEQDIEVVCHLCKGEGKMKADDPELENWGY